MSAAPVWDGELGALRYRYRMFSDRRMNGVAVPEPLVDLWLLDSAGRRRLKVQGLPDTGAAESLFGLDVMRRLGIPEAQCELERGGGTSGRGLYWKWPPGLWAELDRPDGLAYRFRLAAVFNHSDTYEQVDGFQMPYALLGRWDFMSAFVLSLSERDDTFVRKPYPEIALVRRHADAPACASLAA